MDQTESSSAVVGVVAVLALLGSLLFGTTDMDSARPFVDAERSLGRGGPEGVPARLWQDPFDAVERYERARRIRQREERIDAILANPRLRLGEQDLDPSSPAQNGTPPSPMASAGGEPRRLSELRNDISRHAEAPNSDSQITACCGPSGVSDPPATSAEALIALPQLIGPPSVSRSIGSLSSPSSSKSAA